MKVWSRFLLFWLLILMLAVMPGSSSRALADQPRQVDEAAQKALELLEQMTPEERVGQLFLVTFQGSTFDENSQIYNLISAYHIGGVVLQRSNDNFTSVENLPEQVHALTSLLQESAWQAANQASGDQALTQANLNPVYVPLLIGVSQEGDDYPYDQMLTGLTSLPSLMAIGATWNVDLAKQVGEVMGKELAALGINLYFGPSLDVLDMPRTTSSEDLGARVFGGSPYWVGKMGQAYIAGLHEGSDNRLMVVAKHFPGRGGSDRSSDVEIATVRKPLEQLMEVDLAPFLAVTGGAPERQMAADGLLVSHMRYQGFQGAVRSTTRPISSDAAALEQVLSLELLANWRMQSGVLISENLGSQSVRRFYDPTGQNFDARTVAREAFVAGNDLLYVDRFISTNDPDTYTTLTRTLDYFAQKYREDAVFAQRVDASVARILTLKYRLYPEFTIDQVIPPPSQLGQVGQADPVSFEVARNAVTLISPSAADLPNILPRGPESRDRIVFLTDTQVGKQCSSCPEKSVLPVDALQSAVLRLFGSRAGGQISQSLLVSYSFHDLYRYLTGAITTTPEEVPQIDSDLRMADWVIVSLLKPKGNQPETLAFKQLLSERPELLRNKTVIVFAFNAPDYLDATDISKLTAYYALYSKTPPFVEVAARILFQDLFPAGALPLSVPGVGYDLEMATAPDPVQVIPLFIDTPSATQELPSSTLEPTPAPVFRVGDIIPLRTGVIYDRNHRPVPDGTPVRFQYSVISDSSGSTLTQIDTETVDGVARAVYRIDRPGMLEIHASTEQGALSNLLRLDITTGVSAGVTLVAPTPQPTATLIPTPTATVTPTPTATPTEMPPPPTVEVRDWFLSLFIALIGAVVVSYLGIRMAIARWGLRWALCGLISGLLFYNYVALGLPGSESLLRESGTPGVVFLTIIGVIFGWGVGLFWRQLGQQGGRATGVTGPRTPGDRPATGPGSRSG